MTDLLALVDPLQNAFRGTWTKTPDGLISGKGVRLPVIELPYTPPAEYDFEIEFSITGDSIGWVGQTFKVAGKPVRWLMQGQPKVAGPVFGFEHLDGKPPLNSECGVKFPLLFAKGVKYHSRVKVRRDSLTGIIDGKELVSWNGDFQRFTETEKKMNDAAHLALGADLFFGGGIIFHKATITEFVPKPSAPTLPTGPTTWTDTKGRNITATFKAIASGNVLLDIAGKVTPVPLNTLSAESQKLARDLEVAMPKAAPVAAGTVEKAEVKPPASLKKSGWRSLLDECPDAFARLRLQDVGNGWKKFRSGGFGSLPLIEAPDAAIRMRAIGPMYLIVRWREDGDGSHGFKVSVQSSNGEPRIIGGIISAIDEKGRTEWRPIRASELNFQPDEEYLLELRAYGKKIDVLVNGDVKYRASNVDLAGTWLALRGIPVNCTFKDLEWMPLDANGKERTLSGPNQ